MFTFCNPPTACRDIYERVIVSCRDTDVLVLLTHFAGQLSREMDGTRQQRRYIVVHNIELTPTLQENILSYHAITGCDTVNQLSGQGKNDLEGIREAQCTAQ